MRWITIFFLLLLQGNGNNLCAVHASSRQPFGGYLSSAVSQASIIPTHGPAFPFRAGYPANSGGSGYQEHNLLILPRQRLATGDALSAEIRVYDDGGYDYFFNVYWNHQLPLPGELALYNSKKQWICDLAASAGTLKRTPVQEDWTPIQSSGGYAGTVLHCGALPAGTYYVQAIFFGSLIHPPPGRSAEGWPAIDDQTELMRSEAIPITVTAPEPESSAVRASARSGDQPSNPTSEKSPLVFGGLLHGESALPEEGYPFRDASPIPQSRGWGHKGHSVLSVPNPILRFGSRFTADICLYNDGDATPFFNVYWNPLITSPEGLALYDGQKRFVCDLLASYGGSHVGLGVSEWTGIGASGFAGMSVSASLPSLSGFGEPHVRPLPAGTYYLQVIYVSGAVAPPEKNKWNLFFGDSMKSSASSDGQINTFRTQEVFRSNAVQVKVVD